MKKENIIVRREKNLLFIIATVIHMVQAF